ncbi:hypothetical protein WMY93_025094 [Mugilogobius chulae]|uniref:Uncharacterized protein n=1 Tax=Mugilogobius chulae TaxID=88201 RepID=A0AAW0N6Z6_9GOBI
MPCRVLTLLSRSLTMGKRTRFKSKIDCWTQSQCSNSLNSPPAHCSSNHQSYIGLIKAGPGPHAVQSYSGVLFSPGTPLSSAAKNRFKAAAGDTAVTPNPIHPATLPGMCQSHPHSSDRAPGPSVGAWRKYEIEERKRRSGEMPWATSNTSS